MSYPSAPFTLAHSLSPKEGVISPSTVVELWRAFWGEARVTWDGLTRFLDMVDNLVSWELTCEDSEAPTPEEFAREAGVTPQFDSRLVADLYVEEMGRYGVPEELNYDLVQPLQLIYSVLSPPKPCKYGQLGKLGVWLARRVRAWLEGEISEWDLLFDVMGALIRSDIGTRRQVTFVAPWVKRWLAEAVAWRACSDWRDSLYMTADAVARFIAFVDAPMLWLKFRAIADVCSAWGGNPNVFATLNCKLLATLKPLSKLSDAILECLGDLMDELCEGFASLYSRAWAPTALRRCKAILEGLLSDPLLLTLFWFLHNEARTPWELGYAYSS